MIQINDVIMHTAPLFHANRLVSFVGTTLFVQKIISSKS